MIEESALVACVACPRLAGALADARLRDPGFHNRPVSPWGDAGAGLLVVGLAPGYRGANRTGTPFCGDRSGEWVYGTLFRLGLAESAQPGAALRGACITNAVKCWPPANKPLPSEIRACGEHWLSREVHAARVIVALGAIAHASVLRTLGLRGTFAHGAEHALGDGRTLVDCYHPSPLNTQTGRMSRESFEEVFSRAKRRADEA